jgi:hypothetical protein
MRRSRTGKSKNNNESGKYWSNGLWCPSHADPFPLDRKKGRPLYS